MSSLQTPQANSFVCTWEQTSSLLIGICRLLAFQTYFCFQFAEPQNKNCQSDSKSSVELKYDTVNKKLKKDNALPGQADH